MSLDAVNLNRTIIEAFGLDPKTIRPDATIRLDKHLGPIITVEHFRYDDAGHMFAEDGEVATTLRQYKLVPLEDEPS